MIEVARSTAAIKIDDKTKEGLYSKITKASVSSLAAMLASGDLNPCKVCEFSGSCNKCFECDQHWVEKMFVKLLTEE